MANISYTPLPATIAYFLGAEPVFDDNKIVNPYKVKLLFAIQTICIFGTKQTIYSANENYSSGEGASFTVDTETHKNLIAKGLESGTKGQLSYIMRSFYDKKQQKLIEFNKFIDFDFSTTSKNASQAKAMPAGASA